VNSATTKPKLLFLVIDLLPNGGSSCVAVWALQALKSHWSITILTASRPDFPALNQYFGTSLNREDFDVWCLPFPLSHMDRLDSDPFSVQRLAWMMRFCQNKAHEFNVIVGTNDEIDFGRPGVQYTHYPHFDRHMDLLESAENLTTWQKIKGLFRGTFRPWMWISDVHISRIQSNLMVTNSNWTARVLRDKYQCKPQVLYPPVSWHGGNPEWEDRSFSFVMLGRLSPDKRQIETINMIEQVRSRGFAVELEIIGNIGGGAGEDFLQQLTHRIAEAGDWVRLHQGVNRKRLEQLVAGSRFGIHAMLEEHFGIAVAEMLRAGCIVFVHDDGGQVEIVGDEVGLRYKSDAEAVDKICKLLDNEDEQLRLRQVLGHRSEKFSESSFMSGIQKVVSDFAAENTP
jgi:glycosyltransferase involved in cell wall biosynthesis